MQVLLSTSNIKLKTLDSRKLLPRWIGSFKIVLKVGKIAYKLDLPDIMKIHPVFHVSLLKLYRALGNVEPLPPPILEEEDDNLLYDVERVLAYQIKDSRTASEILSH